MNELIVARKEDSLAVDMTVLRLSFAERSIQYGRPEVLPERHTNTSPLLKKNNVLPHTYFQLSVYIKVV